MAQPSREEIIAYIRQLAAEKGIDPETFLKIVEGESGFNPAAVGDQGQSFGLAQLYMGGGLGNTYEQQFGNRPDNPEDWKQHLSFMADQAVSGGKGWEPWHAIKRPEVGVTSQWQGLPGQQAVAPGRRGRMGEVAQSPSRMIQPWSSAKQQEATNAFGMTPKEWQDLVDPTGDKTVAGALVSMFVPGRSEKRASEKAQTPLGGLLSALGVKSKTDEAQEKIDKINTFAPGSTDAKIAEKFKPKQTVASLMFGGETPEEKRARLLKPQQTVGSSLFGTLRGLWS